MSVGAGVAVHSTMMFASVFYIGRHAGCCVTNV